MFLRISSPLDLICAWISDIFHLKLKARIFALSEQKLKDLASTRRRIFVVFATQWRESMGLSGFITTGVVFAIFVGSRKVAARSGAVFVNRTVGVFSDSSREANAFGVVFDLSALHAAVNRVKFGDVLWGHLPNPIGLGLAPVKGYSKVGTTGAATKTGMRPYCRLHAWRTFPEISPRRWSPRWRGPTPAGVPVSSRSPGQTGKWALMYSNC